MYRDHIYQPQLQAQYKHILWHLLCPYHTFPLSAMPLAKLIQVHFNHSFSCICIAINNLIFELPDFPCGGITFSHKIRRIQEKDSVDDAVYCIIITLCKIIEIIFIGRNITSRCFAINEDSASCNRVVELIKVLNREGIFVSTVHDIINVT